MSERRGGERGGGRPDRGRGGERGGGRPDRGGGARGGGGGRLRYLEPGRTPPRDAPPRLHASAHVPASGRVLAGRPGDLGGPAHARGHAGAERRAALPVPR